MLISFHFSNVICPGPITLLKWKEIKTKLLLTLLGKKGKQCYYMHSIICILTVITKEFAFHLNNTVSCLFQCNSFRGILRKKKKIYIPWKQFLFPSISYELSRKCLINYSRFTRHCDVGFYLLVSWQMIYVYHGWVHTAYTAAATEWKIAFAIRKLIYIFMSTTGHLYR